MTDIVQDAHFFRHQYARLVAVLVRQFGMHAIESIEDAAQGALERALGTWAKRGVPQSPQAWLVTVARNLLLDELRRRKRVVLDGDVEERDLDASSAQDEDDELQLLFACSSELVPERSRLVLCLKLVAGFGTRQIAARLFTSEANVQKLLERGRNKLRDAWQGMSHEDALDVAPELERERMGLVEQVLYLIFNEGYSAERPDAPLRPDLCDDALRLTQRLVTRHRRPRGSTLALLSLMHFLRARLEARVDDRGGLLLLSEQERSRWDRAHIERGAFLLCQASECPRDEISRYHGEAMVQAEHCLAPSFAQTRWHEIVELYELLERGYPSPLYVLNRAIALAEWKGPSEGIALLDQRAPPSWLVGHYLFVGTRGELERRRGDFEAACRHLQAAIEVTPTQAERAIFERHLGWARAGVSSSEGPEARDDQKRSS